MRRGDDEPVGQDEAGAEVHALAGDFRGDDHRLIGDREDLGVRPDISIEFGDDEGAVRVFRRDAGVGRGRRVRRQARERVNDEGERSEDAHDHRDH